MAKKGRKRVHQSNAAKMRHYRQVKKQRALAQKQALENGQQLSLFPTEASSKSTL